MVRKKGLGKGLGALIPGESKLGELVDDSATSSKDSVKNIKIADIRPNPTNARKVFDEESLSELAESIKLYGIIQPIVLVKQDEAYEIVAGERRFRAAKLAGLEELPAIIKDFDVKTKDMVSMVENIQRIDLNPYEEAMAYNNIMKEYNITQQALSDIIGKSRTYIANSVRLLGLDNMTISELEKGKITSTQARALLSIENILDRNKYLQMLINKEITVNELEKESKKAKKKTRNPNLEEEVFIRDIQTKLAETIGAKVKLNRSKKTWKLNIEFYDQEQIEEFLEKYGIYD